MPLSTLRLRTNSVPAGQLPMIQVRSETDCSVRDRSHRISLITCCVCGLLFRPAATLLLTITLLFLFSYVQVYTPEMADARTFREQSDLFWDQAQSMKRELEQLRRETERVDCPCRKTDCPFRRHSALARTSSLPEETSDLIERYLTSYSPPTLSRTPSPPHVHMHGPGGRPSSLTLSLTSSDFEVITEEEEEEDARNVLRSRFRRDSPFRKASRKHLPLPASKSMTQLCPPSPPLRTPSVRSFSLPQTFNFQYCSTSAPSHAGHQSLSHSE